MTDTTDQRDNYCVMPRHMTTQERIDLGVKRGIPREWFGRDGYIREKHFDEFIVRLRERFGSTTTAIRDRVRGGQEMGEGVTT